MPLNNGKWLAHPPGFAVYDRQFENREAALRFAVAKILKTARRRLRVKSEEMLPLWYRIGLSEATTVTQWAYKVLGRPAPRLFVAPETPEPLVRQEASGQFLMDL